MLGNLGYVSPLRMMVGGPQAFCDDSKVPWIQEIAIEVSFTASMHLWSLQHAHGLSTLKSMAFALSLGHLDGGEMVSFMNWAQGIFTFDPNAASYIEDANILFKLHLFLGLTIFLLFPFTRLVHMLSVPLRYFTRPGYQIVRSRKDAAK